MDTQLYLRVRGRVLGPYDQEKLQSLVRRGQLSRMHEVSTDGTHWVPASTYAELFVFLPVKLAAPEMQVAAQSAAQTRGSDGVIPLSDDTPVPVSAGAPSARKWYYEYLGGQQGPIDESGLRQMLATGQLDADALVWNESMAQWAAAAQIPGLVTATAAAYGSRGGAVAKASDHDLESLCNVARASRPWVMFLAITAFVYASLCVFGGFLELVVGANRGVPFLVAAGVFGIIAGVVVATGGFMLLSYAARLAGLAYSHSAKVLESAMDRLRTFWIFVSIVLIVHLAFFAFLVIWVFAFGVSLSHYM